MEAPPPSRRAKRARSRTNSRRDWSDLGDGPAGLIAERVLAYDVADYLRFRAVCRPWRQCCTEPRAHGGLDPRFHPRRWVLLREPLAAAAPPNRRHFLNSSTGEHIQLDLPELLDHELLAATPEGLLLLLREHNHVCLLNPLTRHLTNLPPLTTLLPSDYHYKLSHFIMNDFRASGSGIANDGSTVVLCFDRLCMLGMAKPGDDRWTLLRYDDNGVGMTAPPVMFAGRFYLVKDNCVMVLQMGSSGSSSSTTNSNQLLPPPRLEVAARLKMYVSPMAHTMHLVDNCGEELMLLHRRMVPVMSQNKSAYRYTMYRVDLDTGTLLRVKTLDEGGGSGGGGSSSAGGRALFLGEYSSFLVSPKVFPFGSITADTIYFSFDFHERSTSKVGAYRLAGGRIQHPCSCLVPRPHTLVDYLCVSNTVDAEFIPFPLII